ncbi:MAG: adenylate/guanylate cyclase domain-containing protein [Candidatus Omnitrophica bacterium]|nr:adenylate/guanylate cyclase domain-containing protein [Candidatus Omnitrophota bacterium]
MNPLLVRELLLLSPYLLVRLMKPRIIRKLRWTLLPGPFLIGLVIFSLYRLPTWRRFELISYDWRMKKSVEKKVSGQVVIVFIGDETLKLLGQWPLPRYWYASLTGILKEWGARVIAYDILFLEESGDKVADRELGRVVSEAGNVIYGCYFEGKLAVKEGMISGEKLLEAPVSLGKPTATGCVNVPTDEDGVTRRYPLFISYQGKLIPSLGLAALINYYQLPGAAIKRLKGGYIALTVKDQERRLPVDESGSVWLNIYPELNLFPHYAMVQVLQSYRLWSQGKTPLISPEVFADKIVVVAHTAAGTTDVGPVAGQERYLKAGLHASFLENFFQDDFIQPTSRAVCLLLPVAGAIMAGLTGVIFPPAVGFLFIFLFGCLFVWVVFWLFTTYNLWVEMMPSLTGLFVTTLSTSLSQFILERREKNRLRSIFQRYIAPGVMEKLLGDPSEIPLGGERRLLTILFADVRGFTSLAEKISPEEAVELLNRLFAVLEEVIFSHGGTLDKFIGDAVMAIYGAPIDQIDHAQQAVLSAVEMINKLKEEKDQLQVRIGIGIHTGPAVVGNIGSLRRMDYTAIGDAVNLAARIQDLAPAGEIFISEDTYTRVKEIVNCQLIGTVQVKGRKEAVRVYRVMVNQDSARAQGGLL